MINDVYLDGGEVDDILQNIYENIDGNKIDNIKDEIWDNSMIVLENNIGGSISRNCL